MKAREFLEQVKKLNYMIENKLNEKAQWKGLATNTVAQMGGEKVKSSSNQQKMEDAIIRFVDLEREIDSYIDKLIDTKKDVISVIEQLRDTDYDLMCKIYIGIIDEDSNNVKYLNIDEYAFLRKKSISWAKNVHSRGLRNVQRILDIRQK